MKAIEIMNDIIGLDFLKQNGDNTVDTLIAGDAYKEVKKIGVCLVATPEVLKQAKDWGADLLITHEPTFYNHLDERDNSDLTAKKEELVTSSNATLYRYHDSMHTKGKDLIDQAFLQKMGWQGEQEEPHGFVFYKEKSPLELAREIKDKLELKQPRIVGRRDGKVRKVWLALGARGSEPYQAFRTNDYDVILSGELSEWYDCEPVRDLSQMGHQKTAIILGHAGSERDGMTWLAEEIDGKYDGARAKYFECGELYTYVDGPER